MGALAALAGQLIGTSFSPEMWIAVVAVVALAQSRRAYFIALVAASVVLVVIRSSLIPNYLLSHAITGVAALTLWSAIGWGIRTLVIRAVPLVGISYGRLRLSGMQIGIWRLVTVIVCAWLGFVVWAYARWEVFFSISQHECANQRKLNPALGNLFNCYTNPDPTNFSVYMRDAYPIQYFAYWHLEFALVPALLPILLVGLWVVDGFRRTAKVRFEE